MSQTAQFTRNAQGAYQGRPVAHIPVLRSEQLDPAQYARTTCFEAGYLVDVNAGWRNVRPVIDTSACTGCLQCYLYCPDGTIFKVKPSEAAHDASASAKQPTCLVAVDYDFCKGCGICAKMCKFAAITMMPEQEALAEEAAQTTPFIQAASSSQLAPTHTAGQSVSESEVSAS